MFKKILDKYNGTKLNYRISIAIVLGTLLGIFLPGQKWIGELGVLFVGAMKGIAPILVFVLIINSLYTGKTSLDRRFGKVFAFYMVSTILASIVAVTASFLFPQNLQLAQEATTSAILPKGIGEILNNLLVRAVSNPFEAITEANYIGILVWAIIFGIAIKLHASDSTKFPNDIKYPAIHVGEASQDVYLYCASKGLGAVSLGMYDEKGVRKVFKLEDKMTVILAQAIGVPAN